MEALKNTWAGRKKNVLIVNENSTSDEKSKFSEDILSISC